MRPVNLLPAELRPRQRRPGGTGPGANVAMAVLGTLLLMVVAYALTVNQVNSRKTEIARAKAEADQAQAKTQAGGSFADFQRIKETRLASVRSLAGVRFDWERLMRELARVMPDDTWLLETSASTTAELPTGAGGSAASSSSSSSSSSAGAGGESESSASPTLRLVGCTLRQPQVAVLMVRLRKLYRATDVQLGESVEEVSGGGAGDATADAEGCGRKRFKFDLTVTFAATEPAGADGQKVPASLGGGS